MSESRMERYLIDRYRQPETDAREWEAFFRRTLAELAQARRDLEAGRITQEEFDERYL
jgi:hypothetical protein